MVRVTINRAGNSSINAIALGSDENSPYASSTIRTPRRIARNNRRRSSSEMLCPDGLFGLATNTTSGVRSSTAATAASTSRLKSAARAASIHSVCVPSEMIGCIE